MSAHIRQTVFPCKGPGCKGLATHQVYNTWNAPMGTWCERHAKVELRAFLRRNPDQGPRR